MEEYNNQDPHSNGIPIDFAFRFEYHSNEKAPGGYYEYVIEIAPDGSGEIRFRRDYEANLPDEFVGIFDPDDSTLDHVYRLMYSAGFYEPVWQPPRLKARPGDSTARLEVTCGGNFFEITPSRFEALEDSADALYEAIRSLAPETTWKKIEKQFPPSA